MSEPTIDEMLEWLDEDMRTHYRYVPRQVEAIRAFLEQHRDIGVDASRAILEHQRLSQAPVARLELAAVRAFMERVHKRADDLLAKDKSQELYSEHFMQAFLDELKAMEKEAE